MNQYRIIDRIGEGGMGVVYLAEDARLHRNVALKFVSKASLDSTEGTARFHREARATARLNHPNICTVYELGKAEEILVDLKGAALALTIGVFRDGSQARLEQYQHHTEL